MTVTPRNGNGSGAGIFVSWAVLAMVAAMVTALVTGAIQLGAVQTHVIINTAKLDQLVGSDQSLIERLAKVEARQQINETRIGTIEGHYVTRDEFETAKQNRQQVLDRMQVQLDQTVGRPEVVARDAKDKAVIESLRREIDQVDNSLKSRLQIAPGGSVTLKP